MHARTSSKKSLANALEDIKVATRRLAKHQRKWLRNLARVSGVREVVLEDTQLDPDHAGVVGDLLADPHGQGRSFRKGRSVGGARAEYSAAQVDALTALALQEPPWEAWAEQVVDAMEMPSN